VVSGTDLDGIDYVGTARFTHAIPAQPAITAPNWAKRRPAVRSRWSTPPTSPRDGSR
jgi:hypothetical protein